MSRASDLRIVTACLLSLVLFGAILLAAHLRRSSIAEHELLLARSIAGQVAIPPTPHVSVPAPDAREVLDLQSLYKLVDDARARIHSANRRLVSDIVISKDHWSRAWTGTYSFSGHPSPGSSIDLSPEEITRSSGGCFGLEDCNVGKVLSAFDDDKDGIPDGVLVQWRYRVADRGLAYAGPATVKYYFVDWPGVEGEPDYQYLVAEDRMLGFVNDFNRGSFYRNMPALEYKSQPGAVRNDDSYEPRKGIPKLPDPWSKMLLMGSLEATITTQAMMKVVIDRGSADGVYVGMEFSAADFDVTDYEAGDITINSVQEHSATGTFHHYRAAPPPVGRRVRLAAGVFVAATGK